MIVTRQKLKFQEALVSTMQLHVENETALPLRAKWESDLRRDQRKPELMQQEFASRQSMNLFPLPVPVQDAG